MARRVVVVSCLFAQFVSGAALLVAQTPPPRPRPRPSSPPAASVSRQGIVAVDSDDAATIAIDGEPAGVVRPEKILRLNLLPGTHAVEATSQADSTVMWRGVVDVVAGQSRVLSVRLKPLFLVGSWKYTGPENESCRGSSVTNALQGAPRNVVLNVANDGARTTGRLSATSVASGNTTDYVADVLISTTRDGFQASVTGARTKSPSTARNNNAPEFVDLPSAVVSAFVMRDSVLEVNVSWNSGDDLYCTLTKQTPEALAAERQRLADEATAERQRIADAAAAQARAGEEAARRAAQERQALIERYDALSGRWRSDSKRSVSDGDCSFNVTVDRSITFEQPTARGINGRMTVSRESLPSAMSTILRPLSGVDCGSGDYSDAERNVRIWWDQSRRTFMGEAELVSCEGDCSDEDEVDEFVVQVSPGQLRIIMNGSATTYSGGDGGRR